MESFNTQHESFDAPESIKVTSQTFQPAIADTRIADMQEVIMSLSTRVAVLEASCGDCRGDGSVPTPRPSPRERSSS